MSLDFVPKPGAETSIHGFSKCILGISDIAHQLSELGEGIRKRRTPEELTRCVRQMSVSLRSILLDAGGRLYLDAWTDGKFPVWPTMRGATQSKIVVQASPYQEVDYTVNDTGEHRRLKVPGYRHGIVVGPLVGLGTSDGNGVPILGNKEIWTNAHTLRLADWKKQVIFEVDGLVYDMELTIKTVSNKEGAHIDPVVDSDGIYTGSRGRKSHHHTRDDAYIRSRMVKFGPFYYPHVVVFIISRHLVMATQGSLIRYKREVQEIAKQVTLASSRLSTLQERLNTILKCPQIGRIEGLPLQVIPERLVMRPPINLGMESFAEEQARANDLPRYGESYVGTPPHLATK